MTLSLDYSDLSSAASNANKLANELGQYCDDLSKKVQQKMYNVSGGMSSALNSADYYVNAKIKKLRAKESSARTLSQKTEALANTAKRVDEDVSRTIKNNEKQFFKAHKDLKPAPIKAFFTSIACDIKNFLTDIPILGKLIGAFIDSVEFIDNALDALGKSIKYWYKCEGGKEIVGIALSFAEAILAVVILVCAVVFTGGGFLAVIVFVAGVISAVIGVVNAVTNIVTSFQALDAAMGGHPGLARIYAERDTFADLMRETNFHDKTLNRRSNIIAAGFEITDAVCSMITLVAGAIKAVGNLKKVNIKKTFTAMGKNRSTLGTFLPGKPTLWNGIKSLCMKVDVKTLILGDLNIKDLSIFKKLSDVNKIKTIGALAKTAKGIVKDFDKINMGKESWSEFIAKRVVVNLNQAFFNQQKYVTKDGVRKYYDTNFTTIVKGFTAIPDTIGITKIVNDKWGNKTFGDIMGLKGGLYSNIKSINDSLTKNNINLNIDITAMMPKFGHGFTNIKFQNAPLIVVPNPFDGFIMPSLNFNFNFSFAYPYLNVGEYAGRKPGISVGGGFA